MSNEKHLLSEIYMITGNYENSEDKLLAKVSRAIDHGIRMLQLRLKDVELDQYDKLAEKVSKICSNANCCLILNREPCDNLSYQFDGFHMTSTALMECNGLDIQLRKKYTFSAPVHNELELRQANSLNIDFGIITPIKKSVSYPDAPNLGWQTAMDLVAQTDIPLYAAGGMHMDELENAKNKGFVGVGVLGGIWLESIPQNLNNKKGSFTKSIFANPL